MLTSGFLTFDSVHAAYKAYAVLSQGHSTLRGHVYKALAPKVSFVLGVTDLQDLVRERSYLLMIRSGIILRSPLWVSSAARSWDGSSSAS